MHSSKDIAISRGGVEDTRLEAKVKDTKKIRGQGQGQPFRKQTLSRPRTAMLDAKAKDTGGKCSPKKKGFKKIFLIFQAISKNKGLKKFFSGDLQKKSLEKNFQAIYKILTIQKLVLSSSRGQGNF